eukprot:SAG11_NODE_771_length_7253_cov_2.635741_8_plen_602_part_00
MADAAKTRSSPAAQQFELQRDSSGHQQIGGHRIFECACGDERCAELRRAHPRGYHTVALPEDAFVAECWLTILCHDRDEIGTMLTAHMAEVAANVARRQRGARPVAYTLRVYAGHMRETDVFRGNTVRLALRTKNKADIAKWKEKLRHNGVLDVPPMPERPLHGTQDPGGSNFSTALSPHLLTAVNPCGPARPCASHACRICFPAPPRRSSNVEVLASFPASLASSPAPPSTPQVAPAPAPAMVASATAAATPQQLDTPVQRRSSEAPSTARSGSGSTAKTRKVSVDPRNFVTCWQQVLLLQDLLYEDYAAQVRHMAHTWTANAMRDLPTMEAALDERAALNRCAAALDSLKACLGSVLEKEATTLLEHELKTSELNATDVRRRSARATADLDALTLATQERRRHMHRATPSSASRSCNITKHDADVAHDDQLLQKAKAKALAAKRELKAMEDLLEAPPTPVTMALSEAQVALHDAFGAVDAMQRKLPSAVEGVARLHKLTFRSDKMKLKGLAGRAVGFSRWRTHVGAGPEVALVWNSDVMVETVRGRSDRLINALFALGIANTPVCCMVCSSPMPPAISVAAPCAACDIYCRRRHQSRCV